MCFKHDLPVFHRDRIHLKNDRLPDHIEGKNEQHCPINKVQANMYFMVPSQYHSHYSTTQYFSSCCNEPKVYILPSSSIARRSEPRDTNCSNRSHPWPIFR